MNSLTIDRCIKNCHHIYILWNCSGMDGNNLEAILVMTWHRQGAFQTQYGIFSVNFNKVKQTEQDVPNPSEKIFLTWLFYCPACRTSLIATRFWVVVICPIIKCLTVLEFSFIIPPEQRSCWRVYWFHSIRLSVRPSVRPSVCPACRVRSVTSTVLDGYFPY